ncbi:helix-turn-helix transcriptional regulator, partial [Chitinophaga sp. GbtcB8]|uniref:helix-turn-helix transcriptional regulator n=1 Tax=Chitinophaga sp. GbtcB8 TaxID=2824753 RepID=UPI001C309AEA
HIGEPALQEHAIQEPIYDISEQEKRVLQLMLSGMKAKDIADQLYNSVNTLNKHKTNIRNKLKPPSNRELLSFAVKNNI